MLTIEKKKIVGNLNSIDEHVNRNSSSNIILNDNALNKKFIKQFVLVVVALCCATFLILSTTFSQFQLQKNYVVPSLYSQKPLSLLTQNRTTQGVDEQNIQRQETELNKIDDSEEERVEEFAARHVQQRMNDYLSNDKISTWEKRGVGYAFTQHNIVLATVLPNVLQAGVINTIRVINVNNETQNNNEYCKKWTIWIRVMGPEIFAGSATPVINNNGCHWEFPFRLSQPTINSVDEYTVDAKLLMYNGNVAADPGQCDIIGQNKENMTKYAEDLSILLEKFKTGTHQGFVAFKLYVPGESCCEICSRISNCTYWATPPLSIMIEPHQQGCELFYENKKDNLIVNSEDKVNMNKMRALTSNMLSDVVTLKSSSPTRIHRKLQDVSFTHGSPHFGETAYYVGCGWSFWFTSDFPCLDPSLDDALPVFPMDTFKVLAQDTPTDSSVDVATLPKCSIDKDEKLYSPKSGSEERHTSPIGRWVRQPFPNSTICPQNMKIDANHNQMFDIMEFDGNHPECWHRDDLSIVGLKCIEKCATKAHKPWLSRLKEEKEWYGVWKNYNCQYLELTDTQLQTCVNTRRIESIDISGASIAEFLKQFMKQRLENITLYNKTLVNAPEETLNVKLTTFGLPHLLWHKSDQEWTDFLLSSQSVPITTDQEENYWVSGFYYSSEREPHVQIERSEKITRVFENYLTTKGYHMINAFDMTSAFTYDTATQMDGIHIIGPPAKMIISKFFHYLCSKVTEEPE